MSFRLSFALPLVLGLLLSACGDNQQQTQTPPPLEVGVYQLTPKTLTLHTNLPGRTAAYRVAEVRPQVSGVVEERLFEEGSEVALGQQLYQIDDARYRAAHDRALAEWRNARQLAKRYEALLARDSVSRQQVDDALAARDLAAAELEMARIDLEYTRVLAPITGRVGRSAVTEGALVTDGQPQALATIQQIDPIYVDLNRPVEDLLALRADLAAGRIDRNTDGQVRVALLMDDGQRYPHAGVLIVSEVAVDTGTGAVTLRAKFPNPDGLLLPGMFVHARLEEGTRDNALLVPQQAIQRDGSGRATAWVVVDDTVVLRTVETERTLGNQWLVSLGLEAGDLVVTEGTHLLRPGMTVRAVNAENVTPILDFHGVPSPEFVSSH